MSSTPQQFSQGAVPQPQSATFAPGFTLFDATAVAIATLLGTPVAGATLMFVNDRRLGRAGRGLLTLILALVVTVLVILMAWNIPQGVSSIFGIILLIAMRMTASALQGKAVADHVQRGGKLGSRGVAAGVGVVFLAIVLGVVYLIIQAQMGAKLVIGTKDEVFYTGSATQADAKALGNALKDDGYFTDRGVTVVLDKGAGGTTASFVVKEGSWNDPSTVATFDELGREFAPLIGGYPIKIRLLNKDRDVENETTVGKVAVGNDHVYFLGTATEAQAKALGQELKTDGFFEDKGFDVFLSKTSDGTTLSFVVGEGAWNDASIVASFEKIARDAAPAVGGLPIRLRLESTTLEAKKDEMLR